MNKNNNTKASSIDEALIMPINHVKGLPIKGIPNSQKKRYDSSGFIDQIRIYGSDGYVEYDFDFDNHGFPNKHHFPKHNDAHKHLWGRNQDGFPIHGDAEELTEYEYITYIKPYLNN